MKLRREIGRRSGEFSWQPAEDALLDKHFCGTPLAKLKAMFPNRSVPAIFSRARVRGLKRWRDADEGPAISAAAHHQEMAAKYCGGVPTAETVDFAPYLKAIRDWAVNLALKANRQGSPLRRKDAKGENSSWRPGVLAVKSVKSEARP